MSDGPDPGIIRAMFARVAPRYDLLNRLLSLGQDQRWRAKLWRAVAELAPPGPVLDLATGTGDVALRFKERVVVGGDFCLDMLVLARKKAKGDSGGVAWAGLDASHLPFRGSSMAAVTVAFGLRNFPDRRRALGEIHRVLKSGGILAVLEFHPIEKFFPRLLHGFWHRAVVAPIGGLVSGDMEAYRYLPRSSQKFFSRRQLLELGEEMGLQGVMTIAVGLGVAALTVFRKGGKG
ncbi:MAG: ubiquinone/menaquinone biosynthesis methyltransferase [Thermoanaerobaculaceae bacterium]